MVGTQIAHYRLLRRIGAGGMGEVYLAQDLKLDRQVAVKILPAAHLVDERARKRLLCEARAAASLDHPFICKIFDAGEDGGQPFIAMEYVDGTTLKDRSACDRRQRPGVHGCSRHRRGVRRWSPSRLADLARHRRRRPAGVPRSVTAARSPEERAGGRAGRGLGGVARPWRRGHSIGDGEDSAIAADARQILAADFDFRQVRPAAVRSGLFIDSILTDLGRAPSVGAAAFSTFVAGGAPMRYWRASDLPQVERITYGGFVTPGWFAATGVTFLGGVVPEVLCKAPRSSTRHWRRHSTQAAPVARSDDRKH